MDDSSNSSLSSRMDDIEQRLSKLEDHQQSTEKSFQQHWKVMNSRLEGDHARDERA